VNVACSIVNGKKMERKFIVIFPGGFYRPIDSLYEDDVFAKESSQG
jgi:hypothetical protein